MVPLVRMHAFETRLKRMLKSLDAEGMFDPDTGLLTRDSFSRDLGKAVADASDRSLALSLARYSFDGAIDARSAIDAARLVTRLIRNIDFACRDEDGSILVAFTQTDLRSAHVVARRHRRRAQERHAHAASRLRQGRRRSVTLATLKNGDTIASLMQRVMGSQMVAAE